MLNNVVHIMTLDMLDTFSKEWALKINEHLMTGFASRFAALDYYRQNVLKENPQSVSLMYSLDKVDFLLAYVIL